VAARRLDPLLQCGDPDGPENHFVAYDNSRGCRSALTPAQLLDEIVLSVFCRAFQTSFRLQLLPPARAPESGNSIAAAATNAALIVRAMRRPVVIGQP
jgi:hypothetical protein